MGPKYIRGVQYSNYSSLNTLDLCIPSEKSISDKRRTWIVFIHGGAWRDPAISADIFDISERLILASPTAEHIAAFASINYRLSRHDTHPDQPKDPKDPARNAIHPDHINDVLDAISHLQREYGFGGQYVLVGHSAGVTLAFQACMSRTWGQSAHDSESKTVAKEVVPPVAVLGLEGIYDIPALIEYHKTLPYHEVYDAFVHSAFGHRYQQQRNGEKRDVWSDASPVTGEYDRSWTNGSLIVLAHSLEDELVEWEQLELMKVALERLGWAAEGEKRLVVSEVKGKHDEVWSDGREVARVLGETIKRLVAA